MYKSKYDNEKMIKKLERNFNATIRQDHSVRRAVAPTSYSYMYDDYPRNYRSDYIVEDVPVYSISMTDIDMQAFFDYINHLEDRAYTYGYNDSKYFVDRRYDEFTKDAQEERLHREHPALQDAWEQYQAFKIMLEN